MVLALVVIDYPVVSRVWVAIPVACLLIAATNTYIGGARLPRLARVVTRLSPPLLLVLAFCGPVFGRFHYLLGRFWARLGDAYLNEYVAGYIYLALGLGFALSNIRRSRRRFDTYGVVFLGVFAMLILLNVLEIVQLWTWAY